MSMKDSLSEVEKGAFKRTPSTFRNKIEVGGEFEPEANRYHLYISYACPWAHRCLITRNLKGLQDAIGLSIVHPTWQRTRPTGQDEHYGWTFASPGDAPMSNPNGYGAYPCDDCIPDSVNHARTVRDLYDLTGTDPGKYVVPVLWDKKTKTIVNNESSEIIRMFNSDFNSVAKNAGVELRPKELEAEIELVSEWIYHGINNGVYRCGFAQSQEAYEDAFNELFTCLDRCESMLEDRPYIAGSQFTEADVRLFVTLIRFDPVYFVYFKTNKRHIYEYPRLREYVREIYAMPGIKESVNMHHIKTHYFTSHGKLNWYGVIPLGGEDWWTQQGSRT